MKYFKHNELIPKNLANELEFANATRVSIDDIFNAYSSLQHNTELMLYVDTPFCIKPCKYCIFHPLEATYTSASYSGYYHHLLNLIDRFRPIIENNEVSEIYFGGGTPNYMRIEEMNLIKNSIPLFKDIPKKSMECNPVLMTEDKLKFLIENQFTYVSFGIQSLDSKLLKSQNRLPYDVLKLKHYINQLTSNGIVVNCDLLAYMDTGELQDLEVFESDLTRVWDLGCDTVTLYPMFQRFNIITDKNKKVVFGDEDDSFKRLLRYRSSIVKFLRNNSQIYPLHQTMKELVSREHVKNYPLIDIMLAKNGVKLPHKYNCSGHPHHPKDQVTLGFGGWLGKKVYGHIGTDLYYELTTHNDQILVEIRN